MLGPRRGPSPTHSLRGLAIAGFTGPLNQVLPIPAHFERAARMRTEDRVAAAVLCGPDPERHVEALVKHAEAGYTPVTVHQVGPDRESFFRFYEREVRPALAGARARRAA